MPTTTEKEAKSPVSTFWLVGWLTKYGPTGAVRVRVAGVDVAVLMMPHTWHWITAPSSAISTAGCNWGAGSVARTE